jgi:hypothetical protein
VISLVPGLSTGGAAFAVGFRGPRLDLRLDLAAAAMILALARELVLGNNNAARDGVGAATFFFSIAYAAVAAAVIGPSGTAVLTLFAVMLVFGRVNPPLFEIP